MSFDDQPRESGVLQAATQWDPSGGVNPEWLYRIEDEALEDDHEASQGSGSSHAIFGLMLAIGFIFLAVLSLSLIHI